MEFAASKQMIKEFVDPCLSKFTAKFYPELDKNEPHYYDHMNQRLLAKFRRLGYHVSDCDTKLRYLLFSELKAYKGLYDFPESDDEPIIETVQEKKEEETQEPKKSQPTEAESAKDENKAEVKEESKETI